MGVTALAQRPRRQCCIVHCLLTVMLAFPQLSAGQADAERELEAVRDRIEGLEARVARQTADRRDQAAALKQVELELARAAQELSRLRADLKRQQARQGELARQVETARVSLVGERDALGAQVRLSYMTGGQELIKLLLSQENPTDLGRMIVYYDYLNRARSARIGDVTAQLEQLAALVEQSAATERELDALETAQQAELAAREQARAVRAGLLDELDRSIVEAGGQIENLREEERRLADLLLELGELLAGFPVDSEEPFADLRGRLAWPAPGRLAGDFGQSRGGAAVRWNGVLLEAARGTPVRSIYHGRVAFSDWLPGLGLLIIVDHGDGYMSLYGHNEALLKDSGDWVTPGEAIAQVGDSGGQAIPSLYFEIRQNGAPVDPHRWIPGAPPAGE